MIKGHTPSKCNKCGTDCTRSVRSDNPAKKKYIHMQRAVATCATFMKKTCENCGRGVLMSRNPNRKLHDVFIKCTVRKTDMDCQAVCSKHIASQDM